MFELKKEILGASQRIRPHVTETPLSYSIALSKETGTNLYLKCENLQDTGAFKIRGAMNKLLSLSLAQRKQGVVTASSGNHGAAVAFGLNKLRMQGIIFVPENTASTKIANIRNYTENLRFYGTDCMHTELHALTYAQKHQMIYLSPYNDPLVIAGQGTIGLELAHQLNPIDAIFVPVGGGGLIAGIAGYVKSISPGTQIIGCLPENSPIMAESISAGKIIEQETLPTLSDATAGGVEPDAITLQLCRQLVDEYILVSEAEIKTAIIRLITTQHLLVEGAAGVALAALLKSSAKFQGKNVVILLSGGNISLETLKSILNC